MRGRVLAGAAALVVASSFGARALTFTAVVGGVAAPGSEYTTFNDGMPPAGSTLSFAGDGGYVSGNTVVQAPPIYSAFQGDVFGEAPPNGPDATGYVTTGLGAATLRFASPQSYIGLLWGSVDLYNSLTLYDGSVPVGVVTGGDVTTHPGDREAWNTFYVNVFSSVEFDNVQFRSRYYAMEFDDVALVKAASVSEPASAMMLGTGLLIAAGLMRRRCRV